MDLERISRMTGKSIDKIDAEDLRSSDFEEYFTSRIWGSDSLFGKVAKLLIKRLYRAEYVSFKESSRYINPESGRIA